MPDPGTKRSDARRNRELILDAAAAVLRREAEPTLLHVAAESGLSRATVYRHFADIAAVRAALMAEIEDLGHEIIGAHAFAGGPDDPSFVEEVIGLVRSALPMRTRYSDAMANDPVPDAGAVAAFKPVVMALIEQAQGRGEVRADLDADVTAEALIAVGFYTARLVYRDGLAIEQALQVFETFVRGMGRGARTR